MPLSPSQKALGLVLGLALWLLALGGGGAWLYARSFSAGASGTPAPSWPVGGRVSPATGAFTLVVALHPECPCSSATVDELGRLLGQTAGRLSARVVMASYPEIDRRPEDSDLWKKAAAIPGVALFADTDGSELRRFDALTSGETRLYDPQGRLRFKGGITLSRGHLGDNPGEDAVRELVLHPSSAACVPVSTPAFGCAL